jgi:putative YphP/YqiW family bacilliredoxin
MYPEALVAPMRADLTSAGFQELKTPEQVDQLLKNEKGIVLLVVNSVCGCAAGAARPGAKLAVSRSNVKPDVLATVFAGVDTAAVQKAREYFLPYPPSSPSMGIFKNGELVHFIERHHIEGKSAEMIAQHLQLVLEDLA